MRKNELSPTAQTWPDEARARVVALYEAKDSGSISDRIGQMLRDMIAANERLTAELAAERQRAEGLRAELDEWIRNHGDGTP